MSQSGQTVNSHILLTACQLGTFTGIRTLTACQLGTFTGICTLTICQLLTFTGIPTLTICQHVDIVACWRTWLCSRQLADDQLTYSRECPNRAEGQLSYLIVGRIITGSDNESGKYETFAVSTWQYNDVIVTMAVSVKIFIFEDAFHLWAQAWFDESDYLLDPGNDWSHTVTY